MSLRARSALALLLAAATLGVAQARPITGKEKALLQQTVTTFGDAMRGQDYVTVTNVIPPRVLEHIAELGKTDVPALREQVAKSMAQVMAEVKLEDFTMDLPGATEHELAGGEPYLLIPTVTNLETQASGRVTVKSQTLAIMDHEQWYLMRVNDQKQVAILRKVYPEFATVEFTPESLEAVK